MMADVRHAGRSVPSDPIATRWRALLEVVSTADGLWRRTLRQPRALPCARPPPPPQGGGAPSLAERGRKRLRGSGIACHLRQRRRSSAVA